MSLEVTRQELLKQAIYLNKLYATTRNQEYKDQETRIRRIVVELDALTVSGLGYVVPTLAQVTTAGNTTINTIDVGGTKSDYFLLDTLATPTLQAGMFGWNDADGTANLRLKGNNVTLQVGQETVARVVNKTGADLLESQYKVVRVRIASEGGSQGQRLAVVLAQGDSDPDSATTLGVVTETIANNQEGFITVFGNVNGINTTGSLQGETWVDGDVLYLSPTTSGSLTKVKPIAPQHTIIVGYVLYAHNNQGKIFVKVDNGYELDELHNVKITSVANSDLLQYDSSLQVWKNVAASVAVPTPTLAQVTTAGNTTTNAITVGDITFNNLKSPFSPFGNLITVQSNGGGRLYFNNINAWGLNGFSFGGIDANFGNGNTITFATNSTERMRINPTTGNVGIATATDAGYKLDVNGTARVQGDLKLKSNSSLSTGFNTARTSLVSTDISGNGAFFDLYGSSGTAGTVDLGYAIFAKGVPSAITNSEVLEFRYDKTLRRYSMNAIAFGTGSVLPIALYTGTNTNQCVLFTTGNVGINTTTDAGYKLDVNGTVRVSGDTTITGNTIANNIYSTTIYSQAANNTYISLNGTNDMQFGIHSSSVNGFRYLVTGGNEIMRLFKSGNLLLQSGGTFTDGGQRLQVTGNQQITSTGNTSATESFKILNSSGSIMLQVSDNGNIGINGAARSETAYRLRVHGGIWADAIEQLTSLNGSSGVGRIEYYNTGGSTRTIGLRTYGFHAAEGVKGFVEISSQALTYTGIGNVVLHADADFLDHPTLIIRSLNTTQDSFYMQNYHHSQGALFITKAATGGDNSMRFRPGRTSDVMVINTSGITVIGTIIKQGGTASQFLKADGSVDSSTYLTSFTETDTLQSVTDRGSITTNAITVGGLTVDTDTLVVDSVNNRVGIGTATPTQNLHISSSSNPTLYIERTSADGTSSRILTSGNFVISPLAELSTLGGVQGTNNGFFFGNGFLGISGYNTVRFYTTAAERMRLVGGNLLIGTTTDAGQKLQVIGSVFIKGTDSLSSTKVFEVQNGAGASIMDFRNATYAFFGCGQGGGSNSGFIFNYSNTSYTQFSGYNYGAGAGSYKPILMDTDTGGRNQGIFVNFGTVTNTPPNSDTEFGVLGRTSDSTTYISRFRNSGNTDKFAIRADGALFTNTLQGYSGTLNIPTNPPGSTNITITNGLITNIA